MSVKAIKRNGVHKASPRSIYVIGDDDGAGASNGTLLPNAQTVGTDRLRSYLFPLLKNIPEFVRKSQAQAPADGSVIVFHDTGSSSRFSVPAPFKTAIEGRRVSVIVIVTRVPKQNGSGVETLAFDAEFLKLLRRNEQDVIVILPLTAARCGGAAIGRCISVESAVEDFCAERNLFAPLRSISTFRHLIVTAGADGLIHIRTNLVTAHDEPHDARVYFDPYHDPPPVNGLDSDFDLHESVLLVAALLKRWGEGEWPEKTDSSPTRLREWPSLKAALTEIRSACKKLLDAQDGEHAMSDAEYRSVPVPQYLLAAPLPGRLRAPTPWHMLDDGLQNASVHRVNVAMAIVYAGAESVLNKTWNAKEMLKKAGIPEHHDEVETWRILARGETWNPEDRAPDYVTLEPGDYPALPPARLPRTSEIIGDTQCVEVNVPIVRFGALTVAEREEIERLRSIRNLLHRYLKNLKDDKPISIAVFGPPGSGKSFSVKQICKKLDLSEDQIRQVELNVSQFQNPGELMKELKRITSIKLRGDARGKGDDKASPGDEKVDHRMPLVFFDEFDSGLANQPLGWLKYFLAPMWDGQFQGCGKRTFKRAIFVFAGGVFSSFEQFVPVQELPDEEHGFEVSNEHKQRLREFKQQKGPDFISRLAGHINVLPINEEAGRIKHFIRRAIQLRSVLERKDYVEKPDKSGTGTRFAVARVDQAIIYALLTIDRYNHGVRSMESIIRMCVPIDRRIEIASLPSRAQLNMHVDAEEFYRRIYRGRARIPHEDPATVVRMRDVAVALRDYRETPSSQRLERIKDATKHLSKQLS